MSKQKKSAYCVIEVPGGFGVACCVQDEDGYHPVPEYGPYNDEARAQVIVDSLNVRAGITKVRAHKIVRSTMPASAGSLALGLVLENKR
jgi:hypothetical protein